MKTKIKEYSESPKESPEILGLAEFTQPEFLFCVSTFLFKTSPISFLLTLLNNFVPEESFANEFSSLTNCTYSFFANPAPEIFSAFENVPQLDWT
ncbi:MAG: hypothetical protein H0U57_03350 [Tatlockia sp.]|nr:hypothetical protein [Tatlockia sp.]